MQIFETKNQLTIINGMECFTLKFKCDRLYLLTNNVEHLLCYCSYNLDFSMQEKIRENNIKKITPIDVVGLIFHKIKYNIKQNDINFWYLDKEVEEITKYYYERQLDFIEIQKDEDKKAEELRKENKNGNRRKNQMLS